MSSESAAERSTSTGRLSVPTVVETIVDELRSLIMSGDFEPGQRLLEEPLSERFGVSRPPLREALRVLQRDGIVVGQARRGFIVTPITEQDPPEVYASRWVLERGAIELACPVDDPPRLQPLRDAVELMRSVAKASGPEAA